MLLSFQTNITTTTTTSTKPPSIKPTTMEDLFQSTEHSEYPSMCGVTSEVFENIFNTYCGCKPIRTRSGNFWYPAHHTSNTPHSHHTIHRTPHITQTPYIASSSHFTPQLNRFALFELLYFLKCYPTARQFQVLKGCISPHRLQNKVRRRTRFLAHRMQHILQDQWNNRGEGPNPVAGLFGRGCVGCIDSFPVKIRRPKQATFQTSTYSGKYKTHVLKIQVLGGDDVELGVWWMVNVHEHK